jgi:hypothetical protein
MCSATWLLLPCLKVALWHYPTHVIITLESFLIGVVFSLDEGAKVVVVRARSGLCGSSSNPSAALFWFLVTLDTYWTR